MSQKHYLGQKTMKKINFVIKIMLKLILILSVVMIYLI